MFSLPLRVKPGASRTAVGGSYPGPYGPALVVAVMAHAVDGKATAAAIHAVAMALGIRSRDISVRAGHTSRDKLVTIDAAPPDLPARLAALRDAGGARETGDTGDSGEARRARRTGVRGDRADSTGGGRGDRSDSSGRAGRARPA